MLPQNLVHASYKEQLIEITLDRGNVWSRLANEKTELTGKIHEEVSSIVLAGLGTAQQVPDIEEKFNEALSKIMQCGIESDNVIDAADRTFYVVLEESKRVVADLGKDIETKFKDDHGDDLLEDYKKLIDSKVTSPLKAILEELKSDLTTVPINVKRCIDDVVYLLRSSLIKHEL